MARELTSTQHTNVEAGATRPIYIVEWKHSGVTEYLSCSGDVTYDSQAYTAGGLTVVTIEDSKVATIVLPATAARITQIQNNKWRLGICKIIAILAAPGDAPTYTAADGLLVLDGIIESSSFSGETITVTAKSKYYSGALVPRYTFNEVVSSIPAVGSTSTWEGEVYSYEQWLKTTAAIQRIVRPGVNPQVTGRLSTSAVNSFVPTEQTGQKLLTAQGVHIPIVYGRASVQGYIFADGEYSGSKFIGVAWCMGEIYSVEKVFINDAEVPSTVTAKHYRGTTTQTVSPALQLYTSMSPEFSNDMILRLPAGDIGIAYSVFNIPSSAISGAPRFRAIIQGRLVADPSSSALTPYDDYVGFSFDFLTGVTDSGPNAHTLSLNGGAHISSPSIGLELDGTGDYGTIADSTTLELGSEPFTLEIEAITNTLPASPGAPETLICHGSTASPLSRSIRVDMLGDELLLYMSSDGSTWDMANGLSCGTVVGSPSTIFRLVIERVDNQISTYLDGATQLGVVTTAAMYDGGTNWELGACGGAQEWSGVIRSARLTVGVYRYGSPHSITNTPFSDSGNFTAGTVYSENPALAWKDLAENPLFGLGATTTGVEGAAAYCDSALESGAPRCRIGISIQDVRLVESWLDVLANYSNALWFPEGANLKIIPDKIKDGTNGSGRELYSATSPEFGSPLPTVVTEDGISYSVSVEITTISSTSPLTGVSVWFGGVQVIASVTALGVHGATVIASGTSNTIEVIEDGSFNGTWANLSVKRTHRAITQWLPATLQVTGLPEGDKPNAVTVSYTVPDEASGAWAEKSFGVQNAAVTAGDPIVLTNLALPGVYRIEEASNKAIAKLYREDSKTRFSLISTDEEFVAQPGDTVQVVSSYRGVDAPVFVESNRMVSYGRHQITGTIYRDNQYPDTDYTEEDQVGTFVDGGYVEEEIGDEPEFCSYDCEAFESEFNAQAAAADALSAVCWSPTNPLVWPFATTAGDDKLHYYVNFVSSPSLYTTYNGTGTGNGPRIADLSAFGYTEEIGYCQAPLYATNIRQAASPQGIVKTQASVRETGDWKSAIIFTGYNGGTTIDHEMARNTATKYNFYRGAGIFVDTVRCEVYVRIGSDGAGGYNLILTSGKSPDQFVETISLGDISGRWSLLTLSISSYGIVVQNPGWPYAGFEVAGTIDASVTTSGGLVASGSVTGYNRAYLANALTSVSETGVTMGESATLLSDSVSDSISVAFIGMGGPDLDLTRLERAFQANFADYGGGEWCLL